MECFIDEHISVCGAQFQQCSVSPLQLLSLSASLSTNHEYDVVCIPQYGSCYVVNTEQSTRFFTLKRVFTGSVPLTGLQLLHSVHPSSVMLTWFLSVEFQWARRRSSHFCRTKKNFRFYITHVELFTIIIPWRQTKTGDT